MASLNLCQFIELYVHMKMTLKEVSVITSIPISTIRSALLKANVLRSRKDAAKIAANLGRKGSHNIGTTHPVTEETRQKIREKRLAWGDKYAKGVSLKPNGYLEYTRGQNKGRLVHVVKAEALIERRLARGEHVHHKDGNKLNNEVWNLEILSISDHMKIHARKNIENRQRSKDGRFA